VKPRPRTKRPPGPERASQGNVVRPGACSPCHLVSGLRALVERLRDEAASADRDGDQYERGSGYATGYRYQARALRRVVDELAAMVGREGA